jgi:HSP20 family protein
MAEAKHERSESREANRALATRDRDKSSSPQRDDRNWASRPFEFMDRMAEEMDRTFDRMLRDFGMPRGWGLSRSPFRGWSGEGAWSPRIEAFQKGDRFIVRADLPGLKKDDVQVELTQDAITIQGDRHQEHEEEREGYFHTERQYGHFYRTIPIPEGVITETAQANFKNGVLEVSMQAPPAEANRGRRLEINEASDGRDKE